MAVHSNQSKFQNTISFLFFKTLFLFYCQLPFQSGLIFCNYKEFFYFKLGSSLVCKGENPMFEDAEMRTKAEKIWETFPIKFSFNAWREWDSWRPTNVHIKGLTFFIHNICRKMHNSVFDLFYLRNVCVSFVFRVCTVSSTVSGKTYISG